MTRMAAAVIAGRAVSIADAVTRARECPAWADRGGPCSGCTDRILFLTVVPWLPIDLPGLWGWWSSSMSVCEVDA